MSVFKKGLRIIIFGIIVNGILAAIKITAGILGNSYALIADGIESTTDIFSSAIVWSGLKIASLPADKNHPYGHGKAEALAAMIVAGILLVAAIIIVVNSIHEIIKPHHAPESYTLVVLVLVIITKEILFRTVFKVGSKIDSTAVIIDAWHHRSDALTSLAAFIGISIALFMGPGYESADDYAALVASSIIIYNALKMLSRGISDLMDQSPSADIISNIKSLAASVEGVRQINNIKIRKSGLKYFVDMDISVDGNITVTEGHDIASEVNSKLSRSALSFEQIMVHVEPEIIEIKNK